MKTQSIILLNNSRLVRGMLRRVIDKVSGLEIVAEVENLSEYPNIAQQEKADWTILSLEPDEDVPEIVEQVLNQQTRMRLLAMAIDGSQVRVRWTEPHEISLDDKNLEDLITILRGEYELSKERIFDSGNH